MQLEVSQEEFELVMAHRVRKRDSLRAREDGEVHRDCKHLTYDSDGEHCGLNVGYGVGNHCFACRGKACMKYEGGK